MTNKQIKSLQEKIEKNQSKLNKLQTKKDNFISKLNKVIDNYKSQTQFHNIIPIDVFSNNDITTHYSWHDEQQLEKQLNVNYIFTFNIEASKLLDKHLKLYMGQFNSTQYKNGYELLNILNKIKNYINSIIKTNSDIDNTNKIINSDTNKLSNNNIKIRNIQQLFNDIPELEIFLDLCAKKQYTFLTQQNNLLKQQWQKYYKKNKELSNLINNNKNNNNPNWNETYKKLSDECKSIKPKKLIQTDEQIKNIVDSWKQQEASLLADRIKTEFGNIINSNFYLSTADNNINGIIHGSIKSAKIETIFAGGYNIQCLHTRLLIHEI